MLEQFNKNLFNIEFLTIPKNELRHMKEVTNLAIFDSNTKVPHPNGLFSIEIFKPIGSLERLRRLGYIDLKITILHPFVYKHIKSISKLHEGILSGKVKAVFDNKIKDFVIDKNGNTGYEYYMKHIYKIDFDSLKNESEYRNLKIDFIKRGILEENLIQEHIVIPAGLRDYTLDPKGRPVQDEINDLYRKLIISVNTIRNISFKDGEKSKLDIYRYKVQNISLDIFEYIKNILDDKKGYIQGKWATRSILGGTRNVITANSTTIKDLKDKNKIGFNTTVVGLYQYIKSISPLAMHHIQNKFIIGVINPYNNNAKVIDKKTMKTVVKPISNKAKSTWLTSDGLNNLFNNFKQDIIKNNPVMVGDDYLALVEDKGESITVIKDTNEITSNMDIKKLRPITYAEVFYISVEETIKDAKTLITRYPAINIGSIYPSNTYLKTTITGRKVKLIIRETTKELYEYPVLGLKYFNSVSPHASKLGVLGGDFDGDTVNATSAYTKEAKDEIDNLFKDKSFYLSPDGRLTYSSKTTPLDLVIKHLTE